MMEDPACNGRQVDFAQAGTRATRKQTKVVARLRQFDRDALQYARDLHECPAILRGFDKVWCCGQLQAGNTAQRRKRFTRVCGVCSDAGPDSGGAEVDFPDQ